MAHATLNGRQEGAEDCRSMSCMRFEDLVHNSPFRVDGPSHQFPSTTLSCLLCHSRRQAGVFEDDRRKERDERDERGVDRCEQYFDV